MLYNDAKYIVIMDALIGQVRLRNYCTAVVLDTAWDNQASLENDVFVDEFKRRVFDNDK